MKTLLAAIVCAAAFAQAPERPAFDVVSVKPCTPDQQTRMGIGLFTYPGGRIVASNYTVRMLIHDAYGVEMYQITGGPAWLDSDRWVVEAKPPESSASAKWTPPSPKSPPNPEMRLMIQSLLADRFHVTLHREPRTESVYALTVAKGGPKLKEPKDTTKQPFVSTGRTGPVTAEAVSQTFSGQNATIDLLVERLAQHLRRPVRNQTGLEGHYDFVIEYGATDSQLAAAPPLDRAIQDQAGLKLVTQPGSVEVLVIERAEKPTAN
jgi:uncharacterized protein (TIGR03435 family)